MDFNGAYYSSFRFFSQFILLFFKLRRMMPGINAQNQPQNFLLFFLWKD